MSNTGERESKSVMAIPAVLEESTMMANTHLTVVSVATEEEPVINVRTKGPGKEINMYDEPLPSEYNGYPMNPSASQTTSGNSTVEQFFEKQAEKPPDLRSVKKRHLSPKLQRVEEGEGSFLPFSKPQGQESNAEECAKPSWSTTEENWISQKKRKRPDSPLKQYEARRQKLKQIQKKDFIISEELTLQILMKLRREGIVINGQKFQVSLIPVPDEPPVDPSFLKHHGFSPGGGLGENRKEKPAEDLQEKQEPMPTISEEQTLPVFVQDDPLDLSCKLDGYGDQELPIDYSIPTRKVQYTSDAMTEVDNADVASCPIGDTEQICGVAEAEDREHKGEEPDNSKEACNDNLPSLTEKTENLNLESGHFLEPPNVPYGTLPALAQLFAAKQTLAAKNNSAVIKPGPSAERPGSWLCHNNAANDHGNQEAQDDVITPVPDLVNLGITMDDGTLERNSNDRVKELIRMKLNIQ